MIVGGESGVGARPMDERWVLPIRDRCRAARVPFFFKQWGGVRKKRHGRALQGRTYDEMPEGLGLPMPTLKERREMIAQVESLVPSLS